VGAVRERIPEATVRSVEDARSGGIEIERSPAASLSTIENPSGFSAGIGSLERSRTVAAGGAEFPRRTRNFSSASVVAKASIVTPDVPLRTRPAIPSSHARR
jgi:hypothetical protein